MKYELHQLEAMVVGATSRPEKEVARIKEVFTGMALSRKKQILLRRYFRVHRDGLDSIKKELESTRTLGKKTLLTQTNGLADWMDQHLAQFLSDSPNTETETDDPDIDAKKLITSFTLQELGVILRLFIDTGLLKVRNQKALSRFMSTYVVIRTKQVPETFSADHLYNAIHSPALPALNSIQRKLNEMLVQINKLRIEKRKREKAE
jgi:hypothetical protein